MTLVRPVAARAILTAFSTASAPVENRIDLASPEKGASLVQALAELDIGLVWHDLEGGVGEGVELLLHRRDHLRMTVAGVEHGDAAGEIDEALAVPVPELGTLGALGKDRIGGGDATRDGGDPAGLERCIAGHEYPFGKPFQTVAASYSRGWARDTGQKRTLQGGSETVGQVSSRFLTRFSRASRCRCSASLKADARMPVGMAISPMPVMAVKPARILPMIVCGTASP